MKESLGFSFIEKPCAGASPFHYMKYKTHHTIIKRITLFFLLCVNAYVDTCEHYHI